MSIFHSIPLIGKLLKLNMTTDHSPENQIKLAQEYRESIGLGDSAEVTAKPMEQFIENRIYSIDGFSNTKGPGNLAITDKIKADSNIARAARTEFDQVFALTSDFKKAQTNYTESLQTFDTLIKGIPTKYKAEGVIQALKDLTDEGKNAIEAQQKHEKERLTELFDSAKNPKFNDNFVKALNLTNDTDIATVKKKMLTDLDETHKKQLDTFNQQSTDSLNSFHQASARQNEELLFIAQLHKNPAMRAVIEAEAAKYRREQGIPDDTTVNIHMSENATSLHGVKLANIPLITTLTGRTIRQEGGAFILEMPTINPLYYQDPRQKPLEDLKTLAQAVKASGCDKITMTVDISNPEVAAERGRMAYQACIENGFDPKNITITIPHNPKMTIDDLFSGKANELKTLNDASPGIKAKFESAKDEIEKISKAKPTQTAAVKTAIATLREQAKAEEAAAAAKAASPVVENGAKPLQP